MYDQIDWEQALSKSITSDMVWFFCFSSPWLQSDNFDTTCAIWKLQYENMTKIWSWKSSCPLNRVKRKAEENSWPQFDAVTNLCANRGIHGISVVLLRRHNTGKREVIWKKKGDHLRTTGILSLSAFCMGWKLLRHYWPVETCLGHWKFFNTRARERLLQFLVHMKIFAGVNLITI